MLPFYKAEIVNITGHTIKELDEIISVKAARAFNTEGSATIVVPDDCQRSLFHYNTRLKLWRYDDRGKPSLFGNTIWFLRSIDHDFERASYTTTFADSLSLLKGRHVAYTAQTPYADKTLEENELITYSDVFRLDNLMKAYMRENFGSLALDTLRANPYILIEGNRNLGPHGESQSSWQTLDSAIENLAKQSSAKGVELYYDLVPIDNGRFLFKVWDRIRGMDLGSQSISPLVLASSDGVLAEVHEIEDWSNVATYCYALGYDSGPSQVIAHAYNVLMMRSDPFGRIEMTANNSESDVGSVLVDTAMAALAGRRPKRLVTARFVETTEIGFGRTVNYGTVLVAQIGDHQYDCVVDAVSTSWSEGNEDLDIRLTGEMPIGVLILEGIPPDEEEVIDLENAQPVVNAGVDQEVELPTDDPDIIVILDGSATDDGLPDPPADLTYLWTKISGPGTVVFADATDPTTTATIDAVGTYVLRLTADDSNRTGSNDITIVVTAEPLPFVPPLPGDPAYFFGPVKAYILWDGAHVLRTWDLLDAVPVWELVDTGITGDIIDGQYVHVDADTIGMWLLTEDGVWVCLDIMAATPSWELVLDLATVRAEEVQVTDHESLFAAMYAYASEPGYLIVATSPADQNDADTREYLHAYSWHTHDYGQTWTTVDMDAFTGTSLGFTSCFAWCSHYGIAIYASEPTVWMFRNTSVISDECAVFKSVDGGHTWTQEFSITDHAGGFDDGATLLAPFPDITGPSYANRGNSLSANYPDLYVSSDAWDTAGIQATIADHRGMLFGLRVNARTFDVGHVIAWWQRTSDNHPILFESLDAGANWDELYDSSRSLSQMQTPNGWPPDIDVWIDVFRGGSVPLTVEVIRYTDDRFDTLQDKTGNIAALITDWTGGWCGGFALAKVGPNA